MLSLSQITLPALFLAGMQTSGHCLLMCGVYNLSAAGHSPRWLQMQAARLGMYSLLGVLAGFLGARLMALLPAGVQAGSWRVALGLALLALAFVSLSRVAPVAARCPMREAAASTQAGAAWLQGLAWGMMPCPMVYMALLVAAVTGSPGQGGLLLLAFGLGTLPALTLQMHLLAGPLARLVARPQWRAASIGVLGLLTVISGFMFAPEGDLICRP